MSKFEDLRGILGGLDEVWGRRWADKAIKILSSAGHADATAFLAAHPDLDYIAASDVLKNKVAPLQLMILQAREALATNRIRAAMIDSLFRRIRQHFPKGWMLARNSADADFRAAGVICEWNEFLSLLPDPFSAIGESIWTKLRQTAVKGWNPVSCNDPILVGSFSKAIKDEGV